MNFEQTTSNYSAMTQWVFIVACLFLVSCASDTDRAHNGQEYGALKGKIFAETPQTLELTLDSAVAYALENNFDIRVSALEALISDNNVRLEQLKALPAVTVSGGLDGRSDLGASSSRSVITGTQSLEPSTSTDRLRSFYELQTRWNTVDVALALLESRSARNQSKIEAYNTQLMQRLIKREVYSAYMRALYAQELERKFKALETDFNHLMNVFEIADKKRLMRKSDISQRAENMSALYSQVQVEYEQYKNAVFELKNLIGAAPETKLVLSKIKLDHNKKIKKILKTDMAVLEKTAFAARADIRQSELAIDIAENNKNKVIWEALPGGEFVWNWRKDSNSFLVDNNWHTFSASLVQNIMNLIKLPATRRRADNQSKLKKARYEALVVATAFQVHLAYRQMRAAMKMNSVAARERKFSKRKMREVEERLKAGHISKVNYLEIKISELRNDMELKGRSFALLDSYMQMQAALGAAKL